MLSLKVKKMLGKVLRVKFEIVFLLINMLFFTYCIIYHITLNGFNIVNVLFEMLFYYTLTLTLSYSIKDIRKDLKQRLNK